ncbi:MULTISPECIES: 2-amino-4-hydroxy-6-hydroxymethyldihydropteridine diphosphokinase [Methylococcus]|uniref:2-amino-4-hydroxy-6-hydroxymethyldihydropteridine diphosphokinase n=1 Tax=Methylococcus capsulatus TaxID=414 RepID=A0ABZ2F882_METCP|nr:MULTISPECIES: 2-amino-4-hydroxy-6-hydroxymethyldihydropteridine diphosphokinase [Methylococcus]MDF9393024.1 2-amino-4-hydroxy-6-hydroxymethyldihydropteridine diphosphokinase [Methylococcus capsulatus]
MPEVFVSIGSNIDRDRHIPSALAALRDAFGTLRVSSVYETAAVGFEGDPFYNLVVGFTTELPLADVARALARIEADHGRTRESRKFSARTLDLDLLLYGDAVVSEGKLKLPRKELTEYAFMLEPLAEIAPDLKHPVLGVSFRELWDHYDKTGLRQARIRPPWHS